jgi:U-box domain
LSIEEIDDEETSAVGEDDDGTDGMMPVISLGDVEPEPEEDEDEAQDEAEDEENNDVNDVNDVDVPAVPKVPRGFLCPLTLETMFDPVLDAEGNTYERYAILEWLKEHRTSPISRRHLSERMLKPNNSLREAIHEFMGTAWVQKQQKMIMTTTRTKQRSLFRQNHQHRNRGVSPSVQGGDADADAATQLESSGSSGSSGSGSNSGSSHAREKIDCFLQFTSQKIAGGNLHFLHLNSHGCCAFQYDGITVVLDVPFKAGVFCLYTRNLVTDLTDAMKDLLLELNFLQGKAALCI